MYLVFPYTAMNEIENTHPQQSGQQQKQPQQGTTSQKPIIRTTMQKRGRKISPKIFAIWCIIFVVFLIGMIFAAWWAWLKNPNALRTLGITADQAKTLLMIVSWGFFGIIFIISFSFLALNGYRLAKIKKWPKGKFIIGIVLSFIFLVLSGAVWAMAILSIQKIDTNEVFSKNLVVWYIEILTEDKNGTISSPNAASPNLVEVEAPWVTIIGPVQIWMQPTEQMKTVVSQKIGANNIVSMQLFCGNGKSKDDTQSVTATNYLSSTNVNTKNQFFDMPCFYVKKWVYPLVLEYTYRDEITKQNKTETLDVGSINVAGEIILSVDKTRLWTNEWVTEIMAWDSPVRVIYWFWIAWKSYHLGS